MPVHGAGEITAWKFIASTGELEEDRSKRRTHTQARKTRMLPIVGVPEMVRQGLVHYRPLFCRRQALSISVAISRA